MARKFYHSGDEPIEGYRLIQFIGSGGFGQVWKAAGPGGIDVALKIVHDVSRNRGGKELRALHLLKHIRHPNLVPLMAFWCKDESGTFLETTDTSQLKTTKPQLKATLNVASLDDAPPIEELIIVMALAEKSLFDRLQECQKDGLPGIPVVELLGYMMDAGKAIDHLNIHHNIQHCDIKPQNLLLQSDVAQVADFGLAKLIGNVRQTSMSAGTVAYGAPEIFSGEGAFHSTDQYSMATSYYELRTGCLPYHDQAMQTVLNAKAQGTLDFSAVPELERQILRRATTVNPDDRHEDIGTMVRALSKCQTDAAHLAADSEFPIPILRKAQRNAQRDDDGTVVVATDTTTSLARRKSDSENDATASRPAAQHVFRFVRWSLFSVIAVGLLAAAFLWYQAGRIKSDIQSLADRSEYRLAADKIDTVAQPYSWLVNRKSLRNALREHWENHVTKLIDSGQLRLAYELLHRDESWSNGLVHKQDFKAKLKQVRTDAIRGLISEQKYIDALNEIRDNQRPLAALLVASDRDALEKQLKDVWLREAKNEHNAGHIEDALAIVAAILQAYPNLPEAESLHETLVQGNRRGDPELVLEVVENRIRRLTELPPAEAVEIALKCDEIMNLLESLGPTTNLDVALRDRAMAFRQQTLSLRSWVNSQHDDPPWDAIKEDLIALSSIVDSGVAESLSQRLRRTAVNVLVAYADSEKGAFDGDNLLAAVAAYRKSLAESRQQGDATLTSKDIEKLNLVMSQVADAIRSTIGQMSDQPSAALSLCDKLLSLFPDDPQTLLIRSETQIRLNDTQGSLVTLQKAVDAVPAEQQSSIQLRIDLLTDLTTLRASDASVDQKITASKAAQRRLTSLDDSQGEIGTRLWITYGSSLINLMESEEVYIGNAEFLHSLESVMSSLAQTGLFQAEAADLNRRFGDLKGGLRRNLRERIVANINRDIPPDFRDLLAKCELAERDGASDVLIQTGRAESLIETLDAKNPLQGWKLAASLILEEQDPIDAPYVAYQLYVQGLVRYADPSGVQWRAAAETIQRAFDRAEGAAGLVTHRQHQGSEILSSAAIRLHRDSKDISFVDLARTPYASQDDAAQVYSWLTLARKLAPESFSSEHLAELALAAWFKDPPDKTLAARLSGALIANSEVKLDKRILEFPRDRLTLLHVYCQSRNTDAGNRLDAIEGYASLLELAWNERHVKGADVPPVPLYELIIQPGIELVQNLREPSKLTVLQKKNIAALLAGKGRLLLRHRYEDWPFENVQQEVFDAYNQALSHDDSQAGYYFGRGAARILMESDDLAAIRADALSARKADPEFAGGHGLLGKVILLESRELADLSRRPAKLEESVEALTIALEKVKDLGEERAYYLTNRSAAYLEWANYSTNAGQAELDRLFTHARDDAQQAIKLKSSYQDFAYRALGNAMEDLAWIVGKKQHYDDALQAFSAAIETRGDVALAWMDRGRCHFKMVHYAGFPIKLLDNALHDLTGAVQRDPNFAEAFYWRGLVRLEQNNDSQAAIDLEKALQLNPNLHAATTSLARIATRQGDLKTADDMFSKAVERVGVPPSMRRQYLAEWTTSIQTYPPVPEAMTDRIPKLRPVADRLAEEPTTEALRFVAKVHELQKSWTKAITIYDAALVKTLEDPNAKAQLYLDRSAARYWSDEANADLKNSKGSQIIADADQAAGIAQSSELRATALAQAALSRIKAANLQQTDKLRHEAIENLRTAIRLAPKHAHGWYWRYLLVQHWTYLEPRLRSDPKKIKEAKRYLDEAYNTVPAGQLNSAIGRMRSELKSQLCRLDLLARRS